MTPYSARFPFERAPPKFKMRKSKMGALAHVSHATIWPPLDNDHANQADSHSHSNSTPTRSCEPDRKRPWIHSVWTRLSWLLDEVAFGRLCELW